MDINTSRTARAAYRVIVRPFLLLCLVLAASGSARGQDSSKTAKTFRPAFYAFENGVHFDSPEQGVKVLKELGYDGIGSINPRGVAKLLPIYEAAGLKVVSLYVGGRVDSEGSHYDSVISDAITQLKGKDVILELYVQGGDGANDESAVEFVQDIADQAKASSLKVVLYPHTGFYMRTLADAVRIVKKAERKNVGVMFNVCHFLNVERDNNAITAIDSAKHYLRHASICGADKNGKPWSGLIKTLDQGDFDQQALLRKLQKIGFRGPVGLQCYGVSGDSKENLKRSIEAWRKLIAEVNK
ncbi:MAG: TIM barrel protein [Planctomycetota bacterium]